MTGNLYVFYIDSYPTRTQGRRCAPLAPVGPVLGKGAPVSAATSQEPAAQPVHAWRAPSGSAAGQQWEDDVHREDEVRPQPRYAAPRGTLPSPGGGSADCARPQRCPTGFAAV